MPEPSAQPPHPPSARPATRRRSRGDHGSHRNVVLSRSRGPEYANAVRHQIAAELKGEATLESLQPLLQELLDLVPLALADT